MVAGTKEATGKGSKTNGKAPMGDGWDEAPVATSTGSDGPTWCPQWSQFNDEAKAHKLTTVAEGSTADTVIIGKLKIAQAFGEPRYFVETDKGVTLALPNHDVLTGALDKYNPDDVGVVRLQYLGDSANAKEGQRAAILYDVRAKDKSGKAITPMTKPREGALLAIHHENKRNRDAAKAAANKAKAAAAKAAGKDETTG